MWMAQLAECNRLDLADAFTRDTELVADFFEGTILPITEAIP